MDFNDVPISNLLNKLDNGDRGLDEPRLDECFFFYYR